MTNQHHHPIRHSKAKAAGFGLLGHLLGMCDASATGAELVFDAILTLTADLR